MQVNTLRERAATHGPLTNPSNDRTPQPATTAHPMWQAASQQRVRAPQILLPFPETPVAAPHLMRLAPEDRVISRSLVSSARCASTWGCRISKRRSRARRACMPAAGQQVVAP